MDEDISTRPLTQADLDKLFVEAQVTEISPTNHTKKMFERNSMGAARSIINLALASTNDAIRLKAATYVVDRALGPVKDVTKGGDPDDPWTLLAAECVQTMDPSDYERLKANVTARTPHDEEATVTLTSPEDES